MGGNLSEINTTQSLLGLNRNILNTQELTKDEATRALNIDTTIDLRLLSKEGRKDILNDLKNAPKNVKQSTKNLIKDIKTTVSKTEEIIKQTITKQTKDELTKNVDKIKFSKNKTENEKVKDKILQSEEVAKLQVAIDNIKILEEYLKNNNLDSQTIEKLKELGASGEYSYVIGNNGDIYVCGYEYESKVIDDNNIQMTLSIIKALDEKFLKQESKGTYKEILSNTILDATISIQIAVGSSKELYKIGKDTNEVIEDTKELIKEIAKSSQDKNTYEIAKETIKNLPKNIEWTITTVATNISNIENLQALGYKIGSKIYEYKESPLSLLEDTASILTSYDLYKTGLTEENIFYATGLIVSGLALDVSGTPLKVGKTITTTAKEIKVAEKVIDTSKYLEKEIGKKQLAIRGATFEGTIYRNVESKYNPLEIDAHNIKESYRYSPEGIPGLYFSSSERIVKAELANYDTFVFMDRTTYSYNAKLTNMLDVTNPTTRLQLNINLNDIIANTYETTHKIGNYAYKSGYNGIIAPSARADGGVNIILFNTKELGYAGNKTKLSK